MRDRKKWQRLLFAALWVAAFLLAGFNVASGAFQPWKASAAQQFSPSTSQIAELTQGKQLPLDQAEAKIAMLGPEASVPETAAMLAVETLLDFTGFTVEMPLIVK